MGILMMSLQNVMRGIGSIIIKFQLILLALITCTCSGPRLMWGDQIIGKRTEFSSSFGKHAKPMQEHTGCVTLRIEDRDLVLCPVPRQSIRPQALLMPVLAYSVKQELMLKRCLQTRLFQYPLTIHSFLSQYRTEWTVPRLNSRIVSPPQNLPVSPSLPKRPEKNLKGLTQQSTGRIQETTHMMGRNLGSSYTTNQGNGRGQIISSTTGGLQKQH